MLHQGWCDVWDSVSVSAGERVLVLEREGESVSERVLVREYK